MKGIAIRTLFVIVVGIIGLGIIFAIITKILPSMHGQIDVVGRIFDVGDPNDPHKILEVGVYSGNKNKHVDCNVRKFEFVDSENHVLDWHKYSRTLRQAGDVIVKLNTKLKKDKCLLAKINFEIDLGPYPYLYWISPGSYSNPDSYSLFEHLSVNGSGCEIDYCNEYDCNCNGLKENGICVSRYNERNRYARCSEEILAYRESSQYVRTIYSLREIPFFDQKEEVKSRHNEKIPISVNCKNPCSSNTVGCCSQYGCCSLLQNDSSGYKFRLKYGIACGYSPGSDEAYWLACTEKNDGQILLPDPGAKDEEGLVCNYDYKNETGYWVPKKIVGYITNDFTYNYTLSLSDVGRYYDLEGLPIYKSVNNASLKSPEDKKLYLVFNTSSGKFAMFPSEDRIEPSSSLKNKITGFELREFEEPDVILLSLSGSEMDLKKVPECISVPGSFFNIKSIEVKGRYNVTLYSGPDCSGYSSTILGPINIPDISTTSLTYLPQSMRITTYPSNLVRVFVTSGQYEGKTLISPNELCSEAAKNAGLGGHWVAWLSDSTHDAKKRISRTDTGYYRLDGKKIADNKDDLISGSLKNPINISEKLKGVNEKVWTWSDNTGVYSEGCYLLIPRSATYGNSSSTTSWSYSGLEDCSHYLHLYCFENITGG